MEHLYSRLEPPIDRNGWALNQYLDNLTFSNHTDKPIGVNHEGCVELLEESDSESIVVSELVTSDDPSEEKIRLSEFERKKINSESLPDYVLSKGLKEGRWRYINPELSEQITSKDLAGFGIPEDLILNQHVLERWHERSKGSYSTLDAYKALCNSERFRLPEQMQAYNSDSYGHYHDESDTVFIEEEGFNTVYKASWVEGMITWRDEEALEVLG